MSEADVSRTLKGEDAGTYVDLTVLLTVDLKLASAVLTVGSRQISTVFTGGEKQIFAVSAVFSK